ncbi:MAG: hypothetical protein ABL996_14055 [Micropepsaceae bacterium]
MSIESNDFEPKRRRNPWLHLYLFVTGMAGALSLSNILHDAIAWHEFFRVFGEAWAEVMRPLVTFLFSWLFDFFKFEIPSFVKDYLAIGLISMIGSGRVAYYAESGGTDSVATGWFNSNEFAFWLRIFFWALILLTLWPIGIVMYVAMSFAERNFEDAVKETYFIGSTYLYFGLLLVINYVLMHPSILGMG